MDRRKGAVIARTRAGDEAFISSLSWRLALSAAEAVCHGMSETDFVAMCMECYRKVQGDAE